MSIPSTQPTIGLALGSGASRGWSHVGVIKALLGEGIKPDVVCGTSVGAMVGASYVTGHLGELERWVLGSSRADVLRFFDIKFSQAGFVNIERMRRFLYEYVAAEDMQIEDLDIAYAAVSTDLATGREIWSKNGSLADAVLASMAMPGLFPPVRNNGRWLVDGGLVNPVPVSACRALGADVVIGVNLNDGIVGKWRKKADPKNDVEGTGLLENLKKQAKEYSNSVFTKSESQEDPPSLLYAISGSINIFQDHITRSRLAGDPADLLIAPRVSDIGILEFQRAAEAMQKGEECVQEALQVIHRAIGTGS